MASLNPLFQRYGAGLQISPLTLALLLFLIAPILAIVIMSFYKFTGFMTVPEFTIANYIKIFSRHLTLSNYLTTAKMVGIAWLVSSVLGFSLAYFLVFDIIKLRTKLLLFLVLVVPFWTSGVIRTVSWVPFLGREGVINRIVMGLGLSDEPLSFLLFSEFAVLLSYVQMFTLFMMAPLFNVMARIDRSLIEAAHDAGASGWQIVWNVIVPLCKPGFAIGTIFVVSLVVSDFAVVGIVGGQRVGTVSISVINQMSMAQYPPASANAVVLLIVLLLLVGVLMRVVDVRKQI